MQHLVVLQVVQQRIRHGAGLGIQEHGRAVHAQRRANEHAVDETGQVQRLLMLQLADQLAAVFPGCHQQEHGAAYQQRKPAAVDQLQRVRRKEHHIDREEPGGRSDAQPQRVAPAVADNEEGQAGRDQHVGAHGNAIGAGQVAGAAEQADRHHDGDEQAPVDERDVDLADFAHIRVQDVQPRQVAQLNHALGGREGAGDQRLRCNHRGGRGQNHQGHQRPFRRHQVERVAHGGRVGQQQRALAKVVQRQRRHHDGKPGHADRAPAEVPHVRVQGLAAGHAQHHGAEDDEGDARLRQDEFQRVVGVQRQQDGRMVRDAVQARCRNHNEPQHHHRPEPAPYAGRAAFLHDEQQQQHGQCGRDHIAVKGRRDKFQTFHRRQH